jgi:predicted Zn finger-like uncharacterized protein
VARASEPLVSIANQLEYLKPMIIACPACATSHNLPDDHLAADNSIVKCGSCGHSWLEARAVEVYEPTRYDSPIRDITGDDTPDRKQAVENLPAEIITPDTEYEAARIAKAVHQAEQNRLAEQKKRRAKIRGWALLAACIFVPVTAAAAFPAAVVKILPGAIRVYEKVGVKVNVRGFEFVNITHQYVEVNSTRVLAVRGRIINVSGSKKKIPPVRFTLTDNSGKAVYGWTLAGISRRPLAPGEATSFLTRIATPPKTADDIQIRFAQSGEIGSNVAYASYTNKRPQN